MIPTIIFDFDGTIADSFKVVSKIVVDLSTEFKYKKPRDEDLTLIRTQHSKEIIKMLGIPPYKIPFILLKAKSEMHKRILDIQPFDGIEKMLSELTSMNYRLGIVTSNSEKNVVTFLEKNNLMFFDFIQAESSLFGKARVLKHTFEKQKIDKNEAIYVGDEIRDIEAAHKVGIKIISVSWGFNDKEGLQKFNPDVLIDKPKELLPSIQQLLKEN